MTIHPSVLHLSRRIRLFLPIPGLIAAAAFLTTLAHHAYPGYSATLTAAAAGLIPPSGEVHPLFAWAARNVAALGVFPLTTRMNLLSALCGTLCAMLIFYLASRLILFSACEDEDVEGRDEQLDDDVDETDVVLETPLPPELELYNRRVLRVAIAGGLIAALLFTFAAPAWSAATRLDNCLFDLLLALASLCLFPMANTLVRLPTLALSAFLFVLGLLDSAVFVLLLPYYAFLAFNAFFFSLRRASMACWLMAAGAAACALSLYAYSQNLDDPSAVGLPRFLIGYARALLYHHYRELQTFFPHTGWALVLIQAGAPSLILLFGLRALLKERTGNAMVIVLLTTLTAVPGLLNLSMSPLALFQPGEHLPVFGSAVFASVTAIAIAACVLFFDPDDATPDETAARDGTPDDDIAVDVDEDLPLAGRIRRVFGGVFLPILLLLALAACWRSYRAMDARRGLFADVTARETLALMKGRTWMISNGYLDNHLRIQAFMLGRPLTLVSLRPNELPFKVEHTGQMIASSPIFAGQNRQRLQNALSISTVRFVREWFTSDPTAGTHAMVLATPDIWTACGYRAVPEGLAFGGVRPGQDLDLPLLDEENRMLVSRLAPLLPKQNQESGYVAALGETIRMKAGFAANELGVALEEMNQTEAAYQAYSRARQIDPMNISATVNGYALANAHGIHPEEQARLRNTIRTLTANRGDQAGGLVGTLQTYGTIRQQAFYKQQAAVWASLGVHAVAVDKNRKALALSEQTGASILVENATFYAHADDSANAEACYLAALKEDASNQAALSGIINLMLVERRPVEAAQWVQKAREAGVEEDVLLYPTIALSILNRNVRQALALLQEATRKHPRDLRYWTLLADLLLNQGDTLLVERTVLPDMQNALKTPNHFLIHTVRGLLLRKKGPSHFKEARLSLLRALSLNAALPEVWNIVFELDLALRNPDFTEMDAKNLLNVNPDHALANYLMGSLLLARGELQKAEDFQRRSIEIFPTATACNDLGENLRRQGRLAEAEVFVRQSLALSPNVPHALDTLACILFDAGQYDASAEAASEAVACQPTTPSYQLTLLRAQIKQGNTNGVARRIQALTEAMADIPDSLREEIATMKLK